MHVEYVKSISKRKVENIYCEYFFLHWEKNCKEKNMFRIEFENLPEKLPFKWNSDNVSSLNSCIPIAKLYRNAIQFRYLSCSTTLFAIVPCDLPK